MDVVSNCTMGLFRRSYLFFAFFIGYYKVARELGTNSSPKLSHSATGHNSDPVSSSTSEGPVRKRGNFPLAECNEISGKCFSHTRWGPGYRSCDRILLRPLLLTFPPTHPKISSNFVILLQSYLALSPSHEPFVILYLVPHFSEVWKCGIV